MSLQVPSNTITGNCTKQGCRGGTQHTGSGVCGVTTMTSSPHGSRLQPKMAAELGLQQNISSGILALCLFLTASGEEAQGQEASCSGPGMAACPSHSPRKELGSRGLRIDARGSSKHTAGLPADEALGRAWRWAEDQMGTTVLCCYAKGTEAGDG